MTKQMQKKLDAVYEKTKYTVGIYGGLDENNKQDRENFFMAGAEAAFEMTKRRLAPLW